MIAAARSAIAESHASRPYATALVGETFWVVTQRGRRSGYVKNIEANPRERQRILGRSNLARKLCLRTSSAMSTSPLTVRIDLTPR
jgi:hypothetical protein